MRSSAADDEWQLRVDLAALYRIVAMLRWDESIFNHITVRLPGEERLFLINPFGLLYKEVTASQLLKVNLAGDAIGAGKWPVNTAGFVIHSTIHQARDDAHCIIHTHTTAGMAVAQQAGGLRPTSFYSAMLFDRLAYHDFEGTIVQDGERERLVSSLGDRNHLILRNHGLLACGRTIPSAFFAMLELQRACEVQIAAQGGGELIEIPERVRRAHLQGLEKTVKNAGPETMGQVEQLLFAAMVRELDRGDRAYAS